MTNDLTRSHTRVGGGCAEVKRPACPLRAETKRHLAAAALLGASVLAVGVIAAAPAIAASQDTPRKRAAEAAPLEYQVDFQVRVSADADKARVIEWMQMLRTAGASGVSESAEPAVLPKSGEPAATAVRAAGARRVLVIATIGPSGNLFIASEGFRIGDRARLQTFIKKLRAEGAPAADPTAPLWGLSDGQFSQLQEALTGQSQFKFERKPLTEFLADVRGRTKLAVELTAAAKKGADGVRLDAATGTLSLGAALAYALGQHRLAFEPRGTAGGVSLLVLTREESQRPWPVGLPPEKLPGNVAPRLMMEARYQTNSMPLDDVVASFARVLEMPVLVDTAALADNGIVASKLKSSIQIPSGTYQSAIRRTLAPLGLKHELRIDEANRPLLWITVDQSEASPKERARDRAP